MDKNGIHYKQVQLLMRVLPIVAKEEAFALKGGTAINLFVHDFPRLSVDIDLVYMPMDGHGTAIKNINAALKRIQADVKDTLRANVQKVPDDNNSKRLIVSHNGLKIKVELSPVSRGTVYPARMMQVRDTVEKEFGYAEIPVVSLADLYAGKIGAALYRQHPRDLFDIKMLFESGGITDEIRKTFLAYLIGRRESIAEVIKPEFIDIKNLFETELIDMVNIPVTLEALEAAREQLVSTIHAQLTPEEKRFLLSFKAKKPNWELLGLPDIDKLPAVQWKLQNLERMTAEKHAVALKRLEEALGV